MHVQRYRADVCIANLNHRSGREMSWGEIPYLMMGRLFGRLHVVQRAIKRDQTLASLHCVPIP
jgi:hypothetical protein